MVAANHIGKLGYGDKTEVPQAEGRKVTISSVKIIHATIITDRNIVSHRGKNTCNFE